MSIRERWTELDPKKKRYVIIGGAAAAIVVALSITAGPSSDEGTTRSGRQELIKHVLTDKDTRNVGLDSLAAELKALRGENLKLSRQVEKMTRELEVTKRQSNEIPAPLKSRIERMNEDLGEVRDVLEELKNNPQGRTAGEDGTQGADGIDPSLTESEEQSSLFGSRSGSSTQLDPSDPLAVFQEKKWNTTMLAPSDVGPGNDQKAARSLTFKTYSEAIPEPTDKDKKEDETFFMPAGSIITGTLINGMDAPTGNGAQKNPFPSLLRIQKEAILPNRFRADIRECFLIISGHGDLSSERAYLRGETLSCVRQDGGIIESKLDSYAVGEDGKAGVRGRLVSKQGQIIAKSLMAGFLSGVSKAFDVKPVPIIDTSGTGGFSRNEPDSNWLQSSAVSGASSALDRIAEFYLDMADGMFPVIEVDAGRQIDVIVVRGTRLDVKGTGTGAGVN